MMWATGLVVAALFFAQAGTAKWQPKPQCKDTHENFGKAFIKQWCARCHGADRAGLLRRQGAPDDAVFDTAEKVAGAKNAIIKMVEETKLMPPGLQRPAAADIERFAASLRCEFPDPEPTKK